MISLGEVATDAFADALAKKMKVDPAQLKMGIRVEREHAKTLKTHDPKMFAKIALDHLKEIPDYYTRLDKMEKGAKKQDETSSTASATPQGSDGAKIWTPKAFSGRSEWGKRHRRELGNLSGMKVIGDTELADNI